MPAGEATAGRAAPTGSLLASLVVALVAAVVLLARATEPPASLDEFLPLVAAQRLLAGQVPHRDFASLYGPLVPALDAALFAAFAPSLLAARVVFAVVVAVSLGLAARGASVLAGSDRAGAGCAVIGALAVLPTWGYSLALAAALVAGAAAASLVAGEPGRSRRGWLVATGLLLGLASLARHDLGLALAPVGLLALSSSSPGERRRDLAVLVVSALALPIAAVVLLGVLGALPEAWRQLVVIPATLYPAARALPLPGPFAGSLARWPLFHFYGPLVLALAVATRVESGEPRDRLRALGLALLVLVLFVPATVRSDLAHACAPRLALPLGLALLARRPWTRARKATLALALGVVAPLAVATLVGDASAIANARAGVLADGGPEHGILLTDDAEARAAAVDFVRARAAGGPIYVGPPRHDVAFANDVGFYFDARLLPATRHHEVVPWLAHADFQDAAVADLERTAPRVVVLVDQEVPVEPNESARSSGVFTLDRYLAARYVPVFAAGPYHVLERR